MDRCDTEPYWFMFDHAQVPFLFIKAGGLMNNDLLREFRKKYRGCGVTVEKRSGNYAAATMDRALSAWPGAPITTGDDGSFVHVDPHHLQEEDA